MAQFIPEQHYKGVRDPENECPLAFITPYGTDKAAINRMETVDNWCNGYNHSSKGRQEVIKNEAMCGFKIAKEVRRWSTLNVVWRIEDPRGFQLEISSGNMAYLISETVVNKGEFQAELIWVRNGKDNYLLPMGSDEHAKYVLNTSALNQKLGVRDINIGDHIHDTRGTDGIFLGGYHFLHFNFYSYNGDNAKLLTTKRWYAILDIKTNEVHIENSFTGLSIIKAQERENKDYSELINKSKKNNFVHAFKKKPNLLELAKTARFIKAPPPIPQTEYLAQLDDGSVYKVPINHGYNYGQRSFDRMIIDSNTNSYYKDSVQNYGETYHSMSTFGIGKGYRPNDKIQDLIDKSSNPVKLIITIAGVEVTIEK